MSELLLGIGFGAVGVLGACTIAWMHEDIAVAREYKRLRVLIEIAPIATLFYLGRRSLGL